MFQLTTVLPDTNTFQLCVDKSTTEASPVASERLRLGRRHSSKACSIEGDAKEVSLRQYLSAELKLRRIWAQREQTKRRESLRDESVGLMPESKGNCDWWPREQDKFSGRLLVLVLFPNQEGCEFQVKADVRLAGAAARWRPLVGWYGSSKQSLVPVAISSPAVPPALPKALAQSRASSPVPKAKAKAVPKAAAISGQALLRNLTFRDGVAELKSLLQEAGKDDSNAAYWAQRALDAGFSSQDVFQLEQRQHRSSRGVKRRKLGGIGPWVASRLACTHLLQTWGKC